jgi:hypothetical protein
MKTPQQPDYLGTALKIGSSYVGSNKFQSGDSLQSGSTEPNYPNRVGMR